MEFSHYVEYGVVCVCVWSSLLLPVIFVFGVTTVYLVIVLRNYLDVCVNIGRQRWSIWIQICKLKIKGSFFQVSDATRTNAFQNLVVLAIKTSASQNLVDLAISTNASFNRQINMMEVEKVGISSTQPKLCVELEVHTSWNMSTLPIWPLHACHWVAKV